MAANMENKMKTCCEEARREIVEAQSLMCQFSTLTNIHQESLVTAEKNRAHITGCRAPRLRALAARIIARAEEAK